MNPYQVLHLSDNADLSEVKKQYKRLAKIYHPDLNKSASAIEVMKGINKAYTMIMEGYKINKQAITWSYWGYASNGTTIIYYTV